MKIVSLLLLASLLLACQSDEPITPKPHGYYRIIFPQKKYITYNQDCMYSFDYPTYASLVPDHRPNAEPCWKNLLFKRFNGVLQITYYGRFNLKGYNQLTEDARKLAMEHTVKASAIKQKLINYPQHKVYGIYYAIDGNTASAVQFFLTDSAKHYLRGALYFNEKPQADSLAPVIKFIEKDIDRMIASFKWKN